MTSSLDDLAQREMNVLTHAVGLAGTMEEKARCLREDGTFAESAAIHAAYVALAEAEWSPVALEALKRAVFLGWYETVEPGCFTGVGDLAEAVLHREIEVLQEVRSDGGLDDEFEAMLGWYWHLAGHHFVSHSTDDSDDDLNLPPGLIRGLRALDGNAYKYRPFSRIDLERRGQMGTYWISIACRPD